MGHSILHGASWFHCATQRMTSYQPCAHVWCCQVGGDQPSPRQAVGSLSEWKRLGESSRGRDTVVSQECRGSLGAMRFGGPPHDLAHPGDPRSPRSLHLNCPSPLMHPPKRCQTRTAPLSAATFDSPRPSSGILLGGGPQQVRCQQAAARLFLRCGRNRSVRRTYSRLFCFCAAGPPRMGSGTSGYGGKPRPIT